MPPRAKPLADRLWSHVDRSGEHWLWTGATTNEGQPQINVGGRPTPARRVAWELANGPLPPRRRVYSACGNALCLHPAHLTLDGAAGSRARMTEARFWAKADRSGGDDACWPWLGRLDPRRATPYPTQVLYRRRLAKPAAHAWGIRNGEIPAGRTLRRVCATPHCVNPRHHRLVDAGDGYGPSHLRGEEKPNAKLTNEQAAEIRAIYATGLWTQAELAREYGIAAASISEIVNHKIWISRDEALERGGVSLVPASHGAEFARRFWALVERTEHCWRWRGARHDAGRHARGEIETRGVRLLAHRAAWELERGPIPPGLEVARVMACPHEDCVRPDHHRLMRKSAPPGNTLADVWRQIDAGGGPDACWPWRGTLADEGRYPVVSLGGRQRMARRLIYETVRGVALESGDRLLTLCDDPTCCNPAHMYTAAEGRAHER